MAEILASLPKVTDTTWELALKDEAEKAELLAYAATRGLPYKPFDTQADNRLFLEYWGKTLWANSVPDGPHKKQITASEFKAMCDAYATQPTHTAPAAPHGVRDLLLGLVAALLFSALLPSCAAPAQLDTRKVADRDARTKRIEPYMVQAKPR